MVHKIKNCPVSTKDTEVALDIWGKNIHKLQGTQVRTKPKHVEGFKLAIPKELEKFQKDVFMTADIFFVNGIPFFLTLSRKLDFTAVTHLKNRNISSIFTAFKPIYGFYRRRGFRITTVHADNEFGPLQELINDMPAGPSMNLASAREHVPEIERRIRVVKERVRALRCSLLFNKIPALMTIHMVLHAVKMLTNFPTKAGVSATMSPRELLTDESLDYKKHLCQQFGDYCQVHEEDEPRNSQTPRTQGAICMGPSGNAQGGFKFMTLRTCKKITHRAWDEIPMPDTVRDRVNLPGKDQPELLTFTDRKGRPIGEVKPTGVDSAGETQAPQNSEIINDLATQAADEMVATPEAQPNQELELAADDMAISQDEIEPTAPIVEDAAPTAAPMEAQAEPEAIPGVRRSSRAKFQAK
mmetsp:Transcript_36183/g.51177  ORF Transcript_36183/g.51177 Transcript_36183/m.51177 type:complete len:412 (+) Transcript_36183:1053-2288(+)